MPQTTTPLTYGCGHPVDPADTRDVARVRRCADCFKQYQRERAAEWRGGPKGHRNSQKTHCPQGHPFDEANTYIAPNGWRQCIACRRAIARKSRLKHREKRNAETKAWVQANHERHKENCRRYQVENREALNVANRLKKQRRRASGVITKSEWTSLLAWYGGRCLGCGATDDVTIDHVIPVSVGGANLISNVQPLCQRCNCRKKTHTLDFRMTAQPVTT